MVYDVTYLRDRFSWGMDFYMNLFRVGVELGFTHFYWILINVLMRMI